MDNNQSACFKEGLATELRMQVRNYLFTDTVQSLAIQVDSCSHDQSKRMIIPMACSIFTEPNLTSSMPCGVDEAGYLPYALTWKRY